MSKFNGNRSWLGVVRETTPLAILNLCFYLNHVYVVDVVIVGVLFGVNCQALGSLPSFYLAEPHKYQLRAYIYQARDLLASDADGFSGKIRRLK